MTCIKLFSRSKPKAVFSLIKKKTGDGEGEFLLQLFFGQIVCFGPPGVLPPVRLWRDLRSCQLISFTLGLWSLAVQNTYNRTPRIFRYSTATLIGNESCHIVQYRLEKFGILSLVWVSNQFFFSSHCPFPFLFRISLSIWKLFMSKPKEAEV